MRAAAAEVALESTATGERYPLIRAFTLLGRHAAADLSLPDTPSGTISDRHAAIIRSATGWLIRDLDSVTGTWVNGIRLRADHPLAPDERIQLGADGPSWRFRVQPASRAATAAGLGRAIGATVGVLVVASALIWALQQGRGAAVPERAALLAAVDSLSTQLAAAEERAGQLGQQLQRATDEAARTRAALAATEPGTGARLDSLAATVRALAQRQAPLLRAASLDLEAIATLNQHAVALVLAERADGGVISGTGFAVRRSGDTSWVVTSRHVVLDGAGEPARRLGAVFNGTAQNFRATIERAHPTADLALLRVVVRGGTPVIAGLEESVAVGSAVGLLTFPGELDISPGAAWRTVGVAAHRYSASLTAAGQDLMELDGYGAAGMSGSPVFSAEGKVVGVIFGGSRRPVGGVLFAVPTSLVRELLSSP